MKRIKLLSLILCLILGIFTLTSCFTSEEQFTEWEIGGNTLTGGGVSYTLFDDSDDLFWQASDNYIFHYRSTVNLGGGRYAEFSRPIGREDIILAEFYRDEGYIYELEYSRYYCLDTGRAVLDTVLGKSSVEYISIVDRADYREAVADDGLLTLADELRRSERERVTMYAFDLNELQRLDLTGFGLGGFLCHNYGAFFFDFGSVYFLDLEPLPQSVLTEGGISYDTREYSLIKLTDDEAEVLTAARADMKHYDVKYEWEEPVYIEDDGTDARHAGALAVLLVIVAAFGILLPIAPMIYTLTVSVKRKWQIPAYDYVTLGASFLWAVSGIVIFIVLLC